MGKPHKLVGVFVVIEMCVQVVGVFVISRKPLRKWISFDTKISLFSSFQMLGDAQRLFQEYVDAFFGETVYTPLSTEMAGAMHTEATDYEPGEAQSTLTAQPPPIKMVNGTKTLIKSRSMFTINIDKVGTLAALKVSLAGLFGNLLDTTYLALDVPQKLVIRSRHAEIVSLISGMHVQREGSVEIHMLTPYKDPIWAGVPMLYEKTLGEIIMDEYLNRETQNFKLKGIHGPIDMAEDLISQKGWVEDVIQIFHDSLAHLEILKGIGAFYDSYLIE